MLIAFPPRTALAGALLAILLPTQGASGAVPEFSDFEGYPIASNHELDAMRGGFEVNIGGQLLSLAFSLERVSYLNGTLLTSTRIVVPDIAAAILSPQTVSVTTYVAPPASDAAGDPANPSPQISTAVVPAAGISAGSANAPGQDAGSYVTLIQNGAGNSVALSAQADQQVNQALQAAQAQVFQAQNHITVIQNALDNQIISNLTTLNITLSNAALARAIELNAGLAQLLNAQP